MFGEKPGNELLCAVSQAIILKLPLHSANFLHASSLYDAGKSMNQNN